MAEHIVINTGPLIALARMEALHIPARLPYAFITPQEVQAELEAGVAMGHPTISPEWLHGMSLREPLSPLVLPVLDTGEAAVIQLALEQHISLVCLDEWKGRRLAQAIGLQVVGTLGLLGKAKMQGLIATVRPYIERAQQQGLHYHPDLIRIILDELGE